MSKKMLFVTVVIALGVVVAGWSLGQMTGMGTMHWGLGYGMHSGMVYDHPMFLNGLPLSPGFSWVGMLLFALVRLALWLAPIVLIAALVAWLIRPRAPQA